MVQNSTFIPANDIDGLVALFAEEIRVFMKQLTSSIKYTTLSRVDNNQTILSQVEPAIIEKVKQFIAKPEIFSDQELLQNGTNFNEALKHPIRIEVRTIPNVSGAAQIAVRGICGTFRQEALKRIEESKIIQSGTFYLRVSGSASFEINQEGVDKSLAIKYLSHKWEDILKKIKYKPGEQMDCRKTRTVVTADGDGTTFSGPSLSKAPTIQNSTAYQAIVEYLRNGGIYVIISGNHLQRTISRVKGFVPQELISRLLIVANGGANMVYFDHKGEVWELEDYRKNGLKYAGVQSVKKDLDVTYIGDDGRLTGNDREAFEEVGWDRSILVAKAKTDDIIPSLNTRYIGGLESGTRKVLEYINQWVKQNPRTRIFSENNFEELMRSVQK